MSESLRSSNSILQPNQKETIDCLLQNHKETNCEANEFDNITESSYIIQAAINKPTKDTNKIVDIEKDCNPDRKMCISDLDNQNDTTVSNHHISNSDEDIVSSILEGLVESCSSSMILSDDKLLESVPKSLTTEIKQNFSEVINNSDTKSDERIHVDESQNNSEMTTESTDINEEESTVVVKNHIRELHVVFSCNEPHSNCNTGSSCFQNSTNVQLSLSGTQESSLIEDIREIRSELENLTDSVFRETFGLQQLFKESKKSNEKSKAAKKRKKQKQKLTKLAPARATQNAKFAQSTEELDFSSEVEVDGSLTCPVCLEMYYLPRSCHPCGHIFCDPCLRRLTLHGWEEVPCPLCRTVIQHCELQQEFDNMMRGTHADVYNNRATFERRSRFRHFKLPFTPPVPLGRRLIRHLRSQRARQVDSNWMSHDWFKFLLGCTVGVCMSMLIMLLNRVKSVNDVRDVNIVFLSLILGASLTMVVFKMFKI